MNAVHFKILRQKGRNEMEEKVGVLREFINLISFSNFKKKFEIENK